MVIFLLMAPLSHASFSIYFKDGSSREVTKIEFKGQYVELYLTTGNVLRMRKDSIDFRVTGIEAPSEDSRVTIKGTRPSDKVVEKLPMQSTGPSQSELADQWNRSTETAIAVRDSGSIKKGDAVRVVSVNNLGHTVIVRMADGNYKRIAINSEIFADHFEMKSVPRKIPVHPETSPSTSSIETEQTPVESGAGINKPLQAPIRIPGTKLSIIWPLLMSIGLLSMGLVSTILLSRTAAQTGKRKLRR